MVFIKSSNDILIEILQKSKRKATNAQRLPTPNTST